MSGIERFYSPPEIGAPGRREGFKRRRDLLIAGAFTVAMVIVLAIAIVILFGLSGEKIQFETECPASGGIQAGTPVIQADYVIGKVIKVGPKTIDGKKGPPFVIKLQIDRDWRVAPTDKFVIGSAGLLQGNVIKLVGVSDNGLKKAIGEKVERLHVCEIESGVLEKIDPILASVQRQVEALEGLLLTQDTGSKDSQKTIVGILENLREISESLKKQMAAIGPDEVGDIVTSARNSAKNVEKITTTLTQRSKEIDHAVADFGELADRLNRLVEKNDPKIERSLSDTQYMLQELSTAMTPILNNLDETSQNLKELSLDLRKNPAAALWGKDAQDNTPGVQP